MLIDSHCHIDAPEFDLDRDVVLQAAKQAGVDFIVIPAVSRQNFQQVIELSHQYQYCKCALGIHPMTVDSAQPSDLVLLKQLIAAQLALSNPQLVGVGEIGLDFFVTTDNRETQEYFFSEQLKIAKEFNLPVILHVRKAVDDILKHLRRCKVTGGIAHAFNGSTQQAHALIDLGFKLGFGGAMTYSRALHLRNLAKNLPLDSIVLETDSPDIAPEWVGNKNRNSPIELVKIAQVLADLRGLEIAQIIETTGKNVCQVLPKISDLCTPLKVLH
ncbi:MAG: TatD family hydrolase [Bdellovibrio sp.]|nr:TatD family hydrolase [Methylotenera sp.]